MREHVTGLAVLVVVAERQCSQQCSLAAPISIQPRLIGLLRICVQADGEAILKPELGLEFKFGVNAKESIDLAVFLSRVGLPVCGWWLQHRPAFCVSGAGPQGRTRRRPCLLSSRRYTTWRGHTPVNYVPRFPMRTVAPPFASCTCGLSSRSSEMRGPKNDGPKDYMEK